MSDHRIDSDLQFEVASAGASLTFPMMCSALRVGGHVLIDDRPCKIVEISIAKPKTYGRAKVYLIGLDIFTGEELHLESPPTDYANVPLVVRHEYYVVNIEDGYLRLLTETETPKNDVKVPVGKLGYGLQEDFAKEKILIVTVVKAMGEQVVASYRAQ